MKVFAAFMASVVAVSWWSMAAAEETDEVIVEAQLTSQQIHYREFRRRLAIARSRWKTSALTNYKFRAYEFGLNGYGEYEVTVRNGVCSVRYRIGLSKPARFGPTALCKGQSMTDVLTFIGDHSGPDADAEFDELYGYIRSVSMIDYGYHVTQFTIAGSPNPSLERP